ncbi:hypothetical protein A3D66_02165 [Candidatus Kaiserbacteria bacterium RIFCSPHIGHO2_02_FULL_50_9]|uniref:Uncharacterized protein n=1 Tax=Candidatus Kaiserbacteria bacterium RIFCSPLOWO2_01_FULL_51_21 TaxID=1798508 RepID=A0A1F6EEE2_9BACT|nr:MAG: hypothetical protein A2761_03460 [Candidatus Kaiserbacteria bacterium RIFCSPHIGHO2_01_FULL_51_33]OGG63409.1 MAG: hypothetical protein A3D66_02165 [Candidatus Kaiserbacteria bacterium RIFCSPHIGHO2_02_FULL_50_9]OGG72008.1 MAG: hypothetical protein A3A35_01290 [Candidatus Kaiserbacteria bacterium RIFCSPLOWO2_01_FULL_51_21]
MRTLYQPPSRYRLLALAFVFVCTAVLAFAYLGTFAKFVLAQINPVPEELRLHANKSDVIAAKDITVYDIDEHGNRVEGTDRPAVFYAYKANVISDSPSGSLSSLAQKSGLQLGNEEVQKRTPHSRTFSTSREGFLATEIIAGYPQYHRDNAGA